MGGKAIWIVVVGGLTLGCTSAYAPRPGPRVAIVMQDGHPSYVRDGVTYEGGLFGGDIEEAVEGNPKAEDAARSYKTTLIAGFSSILGGTVAFIGGTGLAVAGATDHSDSGNKQAVAGTALMLGGAVAYFVGIALTASAQPKLYDVVNIYNDGVDAQSAGAEVDARSSVPNVGPTRAAAQSGATPPNATATEP
jgi:hypothetical protein